MKITKRVFGYAASGEPVFLFRLVLDNGAYAEICNYGATLVSVVVPGKKGRFNDVVLGYTSLDGYISDTCYLGATVGRFANRIGDAQFHLNGKLYQLEQNDGENTNHGGFSGFHKKIWDYEIKDSGLVLTLESPDGEGGYPGNIRVEVSYTFTENMCLLIHYKGRTDRDTYLNLTNHAYFNLSGTGNILDHKLFIPSAYMLDTTQQYIPTGEMIPVRNTVFDFSAPMCLGTHIHEPLPQLIWNKGYNHCYEVRNNKKIALAAELTCEESGRSLEVHTTLPGILLYTAGFLDSALPGKSGSRYSPYEGVCLEAQYFPDTPHHANFPSCLLTPVDEYDEQIEYRFKIVE
ncbi:galactose mutarotase [Barnesiella propionica]|uniref:aldose epimerase family protein n=1 Tax=Barnesiella propionica TaxID=2981781 RepID=UPI0011C9F026|nr:aldose epimerase family protein [Barnesiella propionica]MCU6769708.1 galactose mutarotase [Barnesiella propionica]